MMLDNKELTAKEQWQKHREPISIDGRESEPRTDFDRRSRIRIGRSRPGFACQDPVRG